MRKAQTAIEYVLIIGAAILLVVIVFYILRGGVISTAISSNTNSTGTFLNYTSTCNATIPDSQMEPCVGGDRSRVCVSPGLWGPWSSCG